MRSLILLVLFSLASAAVQGAVGSALEKARPDVQEGLLLAWPEDEGWHVVRQQDNEKIRRVELLPRGQTSADWTQFGTMTWFKNLRGTDVRSVPQSYLKLYSSRCPQVRSTTHLVEPDATYPRIIFSMECPGFTKDGSAESGMWLAVQGRNGLYVAHRVTKEPVLSDELRTRWLEWLKSGRVIEK